MHLLHFVILISIYFYLSQRYSSICSQHWFSVFYQDTFGFISWLRNWNKVQNTRNYKNTAIFICFCFCFVVDCSFPIYYILTMNDKFNWKYIWFFQVFRALTHNMHPNHFFLSRIPNCNICLSKHNRSTKHKHIKCFSVSVWVVLNGFFFTVFLLFNFFSFVCDMCLNKSVFICLTHFDKINFFLFSFSV